MKVLNNPMSSLKSGAWKTFLFGMRKAEEFDVPCPGGHIAGPC